MLVLIQVHLAFSVCDIPGLLHLSSSTADARLVTISAWLFWEEVAGAVASLILASRAARCSASSSCLVFSPAAAMLSCWAACCPKSSASFASCRKQLSDNSLMLVCNPLFLLLTDNQQAAVSLLKSCDDGPSHGLRNSSALQESSWEHRLHIHHRSAMPCVIIHSIFWGGRLLAYTYALRRADIRSKHGSQLLLIYDSPDPQVQVDEQIEVKDKWLYLQSLLPFFLWSCTVLCTRFFKLTGTLSFMLCFSMGESPSPCGLRWNIIFQTEGRIALHFHNQ